MTDRADVDCSARGPGGEVAVGECRHRAGESRTVRGFEWGGRQARSNRWAANLKIGHGALAAQLLGAA